MMKKGQLDPDRNRMMMELIGSEVRVDEHPDAKLRGLQGTLMDETRNMLLVAVGGRRRWVPKVGGSFSFRPYGSDNVRWTEVEGRSIMFRPEDRTRKCERMIVEDGRVEPR
jgi:RNase P/RNase MRP subunit p29